MPSEHEKETAFLRRCIRYDESSDGRQLDEQIIQVQRDERCLRRASWLMAVVGLLAVAGLVYGAVLLDDFPYHLSLFASQLVIKVICALLIGSLLCLLAFGGYGVIHRRELNRRREECRRRVTQLLEAHLGNPLAPPRNGKLKEQDASQLRSQHNELAPDALTQPKLL